MSGSSAGGALVGGGLITQLNDCLVELLISGTLRLGEGGCSAGEYESHVPW